MTVKFLSDPELALPSVPNYLKDPTIFEDKRLGIVMVADWGVRPTPEGNIPEQNYWVFRLHDNDSYCYGKPAAHWCSERKATSEDLMTVKSLHDLAQTK